MLKLTASRVLSKSFIEAIGTLSRDRSLTIKDSWALVEVVKALDGFAKTAQSIAQKVFEKYGATKSAGPTLSLNKETLTEEQRKNFEADMQELQNTEIEIPLKKKIKVPDTIQGLSAQDLIELSDIIER